MKTATLLALPFSLVLAGMVASTVACSHPVLQPYGDEYDDEDEDEGSSASSKKSSNKGSSNKGSSTPAPSDTTPPAPSGTVPPPPEPVPSDDPEACMDQCVASGPAAQYWQCSATCQNIQCDDNCWFGSICGQQENACIQSLESCDQQCGFSAGQGGF